MERKYNSLNAFWSGIIAEELARNEIELINVTPGSRNTPLTVAFDDHSDLRTVSHLDERCSSFFALGSTKMRHRPTVIVCTSGTAAAEFHPAVLEAHESSLPVIVMSADRPGELQNTGANQTTNQQNLYGDAVRWFHHVSEPELDERKIKHLRLMINRAIEESIKQRPGPVHLNVPFRKPLEPSNEPSSEVQTFIEEYPLASKGRSDGSYTNLTSSRNEPSDTQVGSVLNALKNSDKPILYFGPLAACRQQSYSPWKDLSVQAQIPVMVDSLTGQRYFNSAENWNPLAAYEHYVDSLSKHSNLEPDLVIRLGQPPNASQNLMEFFDSTSAHQLLIDDYHPCPDRSLVADERITTDLHSMGRQILDSSDLDKIGSKVFLEHLTELDQETRDELNQRLQDSHDCQEIVLARRLFKEFNSSDILFVGNSTPIRDLIEYSCHRNSDYSIAANRGLSGIDGLVSTSAGLSFASGKYVVSLIGDVSFYHDMNGMLAFNRLEIPGCLIVINNNGGGIFHRLPIEDVDPPFSELVKTSHEMVFDAVAEQFNAQYSVTETVDEVIQTYRKARGNENFQVIEFQTNSENNQRNREIISKEIKQSVLPE
jgi:2-succinyl-5-enolpyruvyl-6-hydroxy-3-cyclohexene-1-carboxylate synthase